MKIKLEFDLTPKEFRDALGLPDIAGLQDKVVKGLQSRVGAGVADINVPKLMENWLSQGLATSRQLQGLFSAAMSGATESDEKKSTKKKSSKKDD